MPDYEVQDERGRKLTMRGDTPPTEADIDAAFKATFPETGSADAGRPGFVSRATESATGIGKGMVELGKVAASGIPGVSGLFPSTAVAAQNMQQGLVDVGKEFISGHPFKAGARLAGINPENLYADYKAGNVPAMLGDVAVPAALAAGPKMFREVGPEVDAALARVKAARAVKSTADANEAYFSNLGKAIGPTAKSPSKDVMNKTAAKPFLVADHAVKPIENIPHVVESLDRGIGTIQGKVKSYVDLYKTELIETDPLAAAETALKAMKGRSSDVPKGLAELDDLGLEQPTTFERSFDLIGRLNAENKPILAKNNYDLATARATDPGFVAREAAVASLRDGLYNGLAKRGIQGVRQLRRDEGALIAVRNAAQKNIFKGDQPIGGSAAMSLPARIASKGLKYGTGAATAATGYAYGGNLGGVLGVAVGGPLGEALSRRFVPRVTRNDLIKGAFKDATAGKPVYPTVPTTVPPAASPVAPPAPAAPAAVIPSQPTAGSLPLQPAYAQAAVAQSPGTVPRGGAIAENGPLEHPAPDPSPQLQPEGRYGTGALKGGATALPESVREHFQSLVPFARKEGFRGTVEELAGHYNDLLNEARTIAKESAVSDEDVVNSHDLIKAISDAGGLGIEAEGPHGMSGELEHILESLHKGTKATAIVKRGPRAGQEQALPPRQSGGIPGASKVIVRKGGYSVDRILEHLNQQSRFHFNSIEDFLQTLTDAVFEETQGTGPKANTQGLTDIMAHMLGVKRDAKWWEAPAGDADFAFGENDAPTKDIK